VDGKGGSEFPVIPPGDAGKAACADCGRVFRYGDPYAERLIWLAGQRPFTEAVCLTCDYNPQFTLEACE
jgi:hypothetical protein